VSDTVDGFLKAGEVPNIEGKTFNLGVGAEITIAELAEKIIAIIGQAVEIQIDPSRIRPQKSEVQRLLSNNSRAQANLGWVPRISLDQGLQHTIQWIANHLDIYRPEKYQL
jgi:dTDP-glucose 4,6-dehydratase